MSPLTGVRVVTLAPNLPGPAAAHRLVTLGARVTKVESPSGDPLATAAPAYYRELATGQGVVTLDLRTDDGQARLATLLADADLLVTSSRPRSLAGLGLAWPDLHARFPRLCQVAVIGRTGADADLPGHDLTYQAQAGTLTPPQLPVLPVADLAGAERVVGEALALLLQAARTGEGAFREVSLAQVVADFAACVRHGLTGPGTPLGGGLPTYGIYRARQGWVALAALEPHFVARLAEATGVDPMDGDALSSLFAGRTARQWAVWAAAVDVPLVEVAVD